MIYTVIGLGNLLIGAAYAGLGLLSAWETITLHRYRGWSRFGIGFSLMAASCGPHHLVHGWHVLQGGEITWPMFAATVIGLPSGLIFLLLRLETALGGRGERLRAASPHSAVLLAGVFAITAGVLGTWALVKPTTDLFLLDLCTSTGSQGRGAGVELSSLSFLANLFVTVTYGMVGWYLASHQVRHYLAYGTWSLSGIALAGVFFTCAQMHFINGLSGDDGLRLAFDLIGIPASVYFLWIVKQVHNDFVMDWNRRPLVGAATAPSRRSPWSGGQGSR